ncbi:MAG: RNA-dependent ATPase [Sarea resinae]|nr:MAG: RNA-dependent ATPase [Sarea resinae]
MGKRIREDAALLAEKAADSSADAVVHPSKKSRKSKSSAENLNPVVANGDSSAAAIVSNDVDADGEKQLSKEERKEKKRLKKLKKAEKAKKDERGHPEAEVKDDSEDKADEDAAAAKAARKAEKAERKAKKLAKKQKTGHEAELESSTTATTNGVTNEAANTRASTTVSGSVVPVSSSLGAYVQDPALTALPQAEIDSFLQKHFITVTDPSSTSPVLRPITSFSFLPITDEAQRAPFKTFASPTPIQSAAWPFLFAGRDVVGVAETGSGKTLAFGVPCIRYIDSLPKSKKQRGAKAVIVSPTRELAMQIHDQMIKLATPAGLSVVCVYGGVAKEDQRRMLKTASIVVATPGRLNDLINEGSADLSNVGYLVLDEADRMLDKGFEEEIRKIINTTPPKEHRQTLMFTATWPTSVQDLAATFMRTPVKIAIGDNPTGELRANTRIAQTVEVVDPRGKEQRLLQLLKQHQSGRQRDDRILVFCLYKKEATRVENFLRVQGGLRVAGIHGDLSQQQRTASLDAFKSGKVPLLVATDVAARGLDIPAVKMVINVTFPLTVEDYVHRIGRTGRAGADGIAITLFTEHDKAQSGALINVLKAANQPIPDELLKFGTTVKKKGHEAYGAFFKDTGAATKTATKIRFD